jgi:hypothetical protein
MPIFPSSTSSSLIRRLIFHLLAMNKEFADQLSSSDSVNRILQLMNNGRLDPTCLCALADLIIRQLNVLERSRKDIFSFIEAIQNGNHRSILSSSYERQMSREQLRHDINQLRVQIVHLEKRVRAPDELDQRMEEERRQVRELVAVLISEGKKGVVRRISPERPDSIPVLVAILRIGIPSMNAKTAYALGKMAWGNNQMAEAVAQAGAIPLLVTLLKDGTTGEEKEAAAEALGVIAWDVDQMREAVAQEGAIPALVALLRGGTTGEEKKAAAGALERIARGNDQRKEAVAQAGAIPSFVALLQVCSTGEEKKVAAGALLQLSDLPSIKEQIRPYLSIVEEAVRQGIGCADHLLAALR